MLKPIFLFLLGLWCVHAQITESSDRRIHTLSPVVLMIDGDILPFHFLLIKVKTHSFDERFIMDGDVIRLYTSDQRYLELLISSPQPYVKIGHTVYFGQVGGTPYCWVTSNQQKRCTDDMFRGKLGLDRIMFEELDVKKKLIVPTIVHDKQIHIPVPLFSAELNSDRHFTLGSEMGNQIQAELQSRGDVDIPIAEFGWQRRWYIHEK